MIHSHSRRWRLRDGGRVFRPATTAVLSAIVLAIVAFSLWDYFESRRIKADVDRIIARGEPVNEFELPGVGEANRSPAAPFYTAAAALTASEPGVAQFSPWEQANVAAAAEDLAGARAWLNDPRQEHTFALLDKATQLDFRGFWPGTTYGYRDSHLWSLLHLARTRTRILIRLGDRTGAVHSLRAELSLHGASDRPALTDMLRGMWPTLLNLEQVLLTRMATDSPSLATVQRLLAESFMDDVLAQAYEEQRVRAIAGAMRQLGRGYGGVNVSGISGNVPIAFGLLLRRPWRAHELHSALLGYEALLAAAKTPWPDRIEAIRIELSRHFGVAAVYHGDWDFLAVAAPRVATVAVAAERFRLDHAGVWPRSMEDLVPGYLETAPIDPFSGEPIRLVRGGQDVRIYTIGPDRKDDGGPATGLTPPSRVEPFVGDIGFVLGR